MRVTALCKGGMGICSTYPLCTSGGKMMKTNDAFGEWDNQIEEALSQLAKEDPEIKNALKKIEGALKIDFKRRPWKYMSLLEIDPELAKALEEPKGEPKTWWVYIYVFILVGITLYYVSGEQWGLLNVRWWLVVLMAVVGVYVGLWTAKYQR
jgi:hypothetical protein